MDSHRAASRRPKPHAAEVVVQASASDVDEGNLVHFDARLLATYPPDQRVFIEWSIVGPDGTAHGTSQRLEVPSAAIRCEEEAESSEAPVEAGDVSEAAGAASRLIVSEDDPLHLTLDTDGLSEGEWRVEAKIITNSQREGASK